MPRIMEIYHEARQVQISNGNLHQWAEGYPAREMVCSDIDRGVSYVLEESGSVVGVFVLAGGRDSTYASIENGSWIDDTRDYLTIHRLAADRHVHGVADACFRWCWSQHHNLRVDTHEDNSIMRHCITKAGFRYCGIIHLQNGDPRLAYQKIEI